MAKSTRVGLSIILLTVSVADAQESVPSRVIADFITEDYGKALFSPDGQKVFFISAGNKLEQYRVGGSERRILRYSPPDGADSWDLIGLSNGGASILVMTSVETHGQPVPSLVDASDGSFEDLPGISRETGEDCKFISARMAPGGEVLALEKECGQDRQTVTYSVVTRKIIGETVGTFVRWDAGSTLPAVGVGKASKTTASEGSPRTLLGTISKMEIRRVEAISETASSAVLLGGSPVDWIAPYIDIPRSSDSLNIEHLDVPLVQVEESETNRIMLRYSNGMVARIVVLQR